MADIEKELKKVRDEAAQRRVELTPFKKAFENFDEEATEWILETLTMINANPYEAGERFATLAVGNMGQDNFGIWAQEFINADSVDNNENIGDNKKMDENAETQIKAMEERLMTAINSKDEENKKMMAEREKREQFKEINQIVSDLGYNIDDWKGKMLIQVATQEVDATLDIGQRLSKADDLVKERLNGENLEGQATSEPKNIQIGNAEVSQEPLNVPATGGQVGGSGIANINETQPISFNDADDALMTLLRSEVSN